MKIDNLKNKITTEYLTNRTNLVYISLLMLCVALILYAGHLFNFYENLDKPHHSSLIKQGDEYLLRFNLVNNDPVERTYSVSITVNGKHYYEDVLLGPERTFKYRQHIYPPLQDRMVNVSIFRENELVSETTYILE